MKGQRIAGLILIVLGVVAGVLKVAHVYDPARLFEALAKGGGFLSSTIKNTGPDTLAYIVFVGIPIFLGAIFLAAAAQKAKGESAGGAVTKSDGSVRTNGTATRRAVQSCIVLNPGPGNARIWQFDARGNGFVLGKDQSLASGQPLPGSVVNKDWRALWQTKLNIAWLPPEDVFFRVAQFPAADFNETISMVELQLEKLSPMPVAQIVWTIHVIPGAPAGMQTVVVTMVERGRVEAFLGSLEGQGFLADRLELPILDQLQATPIRADGAWLYPEASGRNSALVAWWYGGTLQNLDLISLPAENRESSLREQLLQMAWAGEMEGWLVAPPSWHLVADASTAAQWEPVLRTGLEQEVEVLNPAPTAQLAAATARRAAHADPRVNLLPQEFLTRYHQQFVDRLWMRGLFALLALYLAGIAVYAVALTVVSYRTGAVENQVAGLSNEYTNTIQLKARYQVLKDRQDLKFAALDCWLKVAEIFPQNLELESMNFADGKRVTLSGTAPTDQVKALIDFEAAMRKATINGVPLFEATAGEPLSYRQVGNVVNWNFGLQLKRVEVQ